MRKILNVSFQQILKYPKFLLLYFIFVITLSFPIIFAIAIHAPFNHIRDSYVYRFTCLFLVSYFDAGWCKLWYEAISTEKQDISQFFTYANRFYVRFLILRWLLFFINKLSFDIEILFDPIGIFCSLAIVVEDKGLPEILIKCFHIICRRLQEFIKVIVLYYLALSSAPLLLGILFTFLDPFFHLDISRNVINNPIVYLCLIVISPYMFTISNAFLLNVYIFLSHKESAEVHTFTK